LKYWLGVVLLLLVACPGFCQFPSYYNNPTTVTATDTHSWLGPNTLLKQCADAANYIPSLGLTGGEGEYSTYPNELHNDLVCTMAYLDGLGRQQALQNQLIMTCIIGLALLIIPAWFGVFKGGR